MSSHCQKKLNILICKIVLYVVAFILATTSRVILTRCRRLFASRTNFSLGDKLHIIWRTHNRKKTPHFVDNVGLSHTSIKPADTSHNLVHMRQQDRACISIHAPLPYFAFNFGDALLKKTWCTNLAFIATTQSFEHAL